MGQIRTRKIQTTAQVAFRKGAVELFLSASNEIGGIIQRNATNDIIPVERRPVVVRQSGEVIERVFVGSDRRSAFAGDGVTPISPFSRLLTQWIVFVVWANAKQHEEWLRKTADEDVFRWLHNATQQIDNFEELSRERQHLAGKQRHEYIHNIPNIPKGNLVVIAEAMRDHLLFVTNPLAQIDPLRRWVHPTRWTDENGYQLSDRIWRTSQETRNKIDRMLSAGISQGIPATELARRLEQFLVPGRNKIRTWKPYPPPFGTDASFDAMRLARTEISQAHAQASYTAARLNPYVEAIDIMRSSNGDPKCPICEAVATIDIGGGRVREPYPLGAAPIPTFHPHCMCVVVPVTVSDTSTVTVELRDLIGRETPNINPANADLFTEILIGANLFLQFRGAFK